MVSYRLHTPMSLMLLDQVRSHLMRQIQDLHVWFDQTGEKMDLAQSEPNDSGATIWLFCSQLVVKSVVLQQQVTQARDMKRGRECGTNLDILQLGDVRFQ